jgi:hypothetical protein
MLWEPLILRVRQTTFLTGALSLAIGIAPPGTSSAEVTRLNDIKNGAFLDAATDLTLLFSARLTAGAATDATGNSTAPTGGTSPPSLTWHLGDF